MHLGGNKQNATLALPIIIIQHTATRQIPSAQAQWKSIVFNDGMPPFILFKIVTLFYM